MAITVDKLKFFQSERMADTSDGGGRMSSNPLVSGLENQVFDDISDVDRAAGDLSIRKIYGAVTSTDTDKYLDAGVVIFREPADPAVSVLSFSTGSFFDERDAIRNRLEQTIVRGARWNGYLWGQHLAGQRAVVMWQRPENEIPAVGGRIELVAKAGSVEQYSQFLWITQLSENLRTQQDDKGAYVVREVVCEIAEALTANYLGTEPSRIDPIIASTTALVYDTRYNAEAVPLFGLRPLVEPAAVGDFSARVDSLYAQIIPTSLVETNLPDVNPGGDSPAIIAGSTGTISFTTTAAVIKPNVALYLGSGAAPGSISILVSGSTITDSNGVATLAGQDIGRVDYGNGVVTWDDSCPNYSNFNKAITFTPAARPLQVADTFAQEVTLANRGFVWTVTLTPIPAPQTLRVSYRANGVWYVLNERGNGVLSGVDASYGLGIVNFSTGTVTFSTGVLPDVDSEIIYAWGTPINYTQRGGTALDAPVVRGQTAQVGLRAGYVSISWTVGVTTYMVDDDPAANGLLTGTGGSGEVNYETGEWWIRPTALPPTGTEFLVSYNYGTPSSPSALQEAIVEPIVSGGGTVYTCALPDADILAGSLTASYVGAFPYSWEDPGVWGFYYRDINVKDNGAGAFISVGGTINYVAGTVVFNPHITTDFLLPVYTYIESKISATETIWIWVVYEYSNQPLTSTALSPTSIKFKYRLSGVANWSSTNEVVVFNQLVLDLTRGFQESIVRGSVRFRIGSDVYVETAGQVYRNPSPETGAGILSGSLDPTTGRVVIDSWTPGISNTITLDSLVTALGGKPIGSATFRTPVAPLRPGSFQLRYITTGGAVKSKTVNDTGLLEDADCKIVVNTATGVVRALFGRWRIHASLTPEEKLERWYDVANIVAIGGVDMIWKPTLVMADSVIYNAVAQTTLPPDSALLGINAARLPVDGKGLIFNTGRLALVHHTASFASPSLSPTQVLSCGRVRLYRVAIDDADGKRLPASFYTTNREAGTITMSPTLNLTGYPAPYTVSHTVADLARITATDINGTLAFNKALSHAYPADDSRVSGVLYVGTLQARITGLFAQTAWTSIWSDARIGDEPLAQYNNIQYPISVSNAGAYPDRFLIRFTSSTAFQVIGENLGLIGVGDINNDCAPINALSSVAYFSIDRRGWGAGWSTGNCLRFNVVGANYPVDVIRAVQPSNPSGLDVDSVEFLLIGNVDA